METSTAVKALMFMTTPPEGVPPIFAYSWLLVAAPLLSAGLLLLLGRRANAWGHILSTFVALGAAVYGIVLALTMMGQPEDARAVNIHVYDWILVDRFQVPLGLHIDQLSVVFVLLITIVGSLIHVYSIGYMKEDPDRRKFFAYLNLFIAAMLLLVLANNFVVLYFGWEGVGLASYLLIGFWLHKPSAATAAKKAFVVNRVGDFGMSIGILLMFTFLGTVVFSDAYGDGVFTQVGTLDGGVATWIGLALLLAAAGKSAQFPLQSWLLDAMEGPTPVSALIHAATMVTAGVYLIVRANAIFDMSETARTAVVIIGVITMFMGAIIGCAKDDIKKALAGSTMSQIGLMVLAAGLGPVGYAFAIFHLVTHGFFKAALFLGAGSTMHGMNDEVNMRRYGALRKVMVVTFVTFGLGYLALIGIPPFAGFFSKDEIVMAAFSTNAWIGVAVVIGAGITAFYMTRMMLMTFFGQARWDDDAHPHESPQVMLWPMILLSIGSVAGGFGLLYLLNIEEWLAPVVGHPELNPDIPKPMVIVVATGIVIIGVIIGWLMYGRRPIPREAPQQVSVLTKAARADLYGDAVVEAVWMRPGQVLTRVSVFFDNKVIDGAVNGLAALFGGISGRLRYTQTGYVRTYALWMFVGALILVAGLAIVRL